MNKVLTVVVPNYNNGKYLSKCIESIISQTYSVDEIIIVDDCSTDNSLDNISYLCQKYHNIKLISLKRNMGVSNARNTGLSYVKTEYVTFIDADDFYANKDKLKNEMELIKKYSSRGIDILSYSKTLPVSNDGTKLLYPSFSEKEYREGRIYLGLLLGYRFRAIMRDYCIKTDILRKVNGYNNNRNFYEDWELLLKLSKIVPFYCTHEYGTGYRNSLNGLSKKPESEHLAAQKEIFYEHISEYGKLKQIYYIFLRNSFMSLKKIKKMIRISKK